MPHRNSRASTRLPGIPRIVPGVYKDNPHSASHLVKTFRNGIHPDGGSLDDIFQLSCRINWLSPCNHHSIRLWPISCTQNGS